MFASPLSAFSFGLGLSLGPGFVISGLGLGLKNLVLFTSLPKRTVDRCRQSGYRDAAVVPCNRPTLGCTVAARDCSNGGQCLWLKISLRTGLLIVSAKAAVVSLTVCWQDISRSRG